MCTGYSRTIVYQNHSGPLVLDDSVKLNVKNLAIADVYNPEIDTVIFNKTDGLYLDLKLS
jgi:hypothetical protein